MPVTLDFLKIIKNPSISAVIPTDDKTGELLAHLLLMNEGQHMDSEIVEIPSFLELHGVITILNVLTLFVYVLAIFCE